MTHPSSKIMKDSSTMSKEQARKRVARACDRCRLKKGKCDGKEQCAKCVSADVMCIYTDRKPPQHKSISPAVAEALQSENLTLKKATIIIYKQLMRENAGLPDINGVDWDSEKVTSGKSGRALNHIIQQAGVDNRISNEEIMNYDSDSHDGRQPDSPKSRGSSPNSIAGDRVGAGWAYEQSAAEAPRQKRTRTSKTAYPAPTAPQYRPESDPRLVQNSAAFIDPNLLQPAIGSMFSQTPPTPPTGFDTMDFLPSDIDLPPANFWAEQEQQQQQQRFYNNGNLILQRYGGEGPGSSSSSSGDPAMPPLSSPDLYHLLGTSEKDLRRVLDTIDVSMYDH